MKCPGQDMKYWKENAIFDVPCPKCGTSVEFYKDDTTRKCRECGNRFVNPKMDFGCASYCQFAEQCLGTLPEDFTGPKDSLLKDKVAVEMKRYFHTDFKSIRQATNTARYAENIGKEEGGNLAVILCAAYLHDAGPSVATTILEKVGADEMMIKEICQIIEQQVESPVENPLHTNIIHDALVIRQLQEQLMESSLEKDSAQSIIEKELINDSARSIALSLLQ